jgi:hypothetical protein
MRDGLDDIADQGTIDRYVVGRPDKVVREHMSAQAAAV